MENLFELNGKTALITGGSRGLGKAMALAFADHGADVVVASRKLENCEAVAREIEAKGRGAMARACHAGRWEDCDALVEAAYERFGKVDILVNNAGMSPLYPKLSAVSEALFDKVVAVNLKGPYRLSALIGERMAAGDGGCILNISSTAAVDATPNSEPYGAAKAGINSLTRSFAFAFGEKVRVNCIQAGPFLTDIAQAWTPQTLAGFKARLALGRGGNPEEIVGAALFLVSPAASFVTGAVLRVDGGAP